MQFIQLLRKERDRLQGRLAAINTLLSDYLEQPAEPHAPPAARKRKARKKRAAKAPRTMRVVARKPKPNAGRRVGSLSVAEACKLTGMHQTTLSKFKREGVLTGTRGHYDADSIYLLLERKNGQSAPAAAKEKATPRQRQPRGYKLPRTTHSARPWLDQDSRSSELKSYEWIAEQLKLTESEVYQIVENGRIIAGEHVANWRQIQEYMAHPSYVAPEPVEA